MGIVKRFEDKTALMETLLGQQIIQGDKDIAEAIAEKGDLLGFEPGERLSNKVITIGIFTFCLLARLG